MFSLVSSPNEDEVVIATKIGNKPSSFKKNLLVLSKGRALTATMVAGDFVAPKEIPVPLLYVAGGIGITPFMSHLRSFAHTKQQRDVVLIYSVRTIDDAAYLDELSRFAIQRILVVDDTKSKVPKGWKVLSGEEFRNSDIDQLVKDIQQRHAYVSGPPGMVDALSTRLRAAGAHRIMTDHFSGY